MLASQVHLMFSRPFPAHFIFLEILDWEPPLGTLTVASAQFPCSLSLLLPSCTPSGRHPALLTTPTLLPEEPSPETQWDPAATTRLVIIQPPCLSSQAVLLRTQHQATGSASYFSYTMAYVRQYMIMYMKVAYRV